MMDTKEFFEEYDKSRPPATQLLKDIVYGAGGWNPGDGPTYGVYDDRPEGHHCAWSCRWAIAERGVVDPGEILQIADMTTSQFLAELADILALNEGIGGIKAGRALYAWYRADYSSRYRPESWLKEARTAVGAGRVHYPEYTSFWNPPSIAGYGGGGFGRLMRAVPRPGWSTAEEIIEKARQA